MPANPGEVLFLFILVVLLSSGAAWIIGLRYRAAMRRLMRAPGAGPPGAVTAGTRAQHESPDSVSLTSNRRAGLQLSAVLVGLSCLIATTSAGLWMWLAFPGEPLPPKRVAAMALLYVWPVIPALGLMWRWPRWRTFAALVLWCVFAFIVLLWRSIEPRPLELLVAMAGEIGPSIVVVAMLLLGNATRAIAPWLLLPFTGLAWASNAGIKVASALVDRQSPLLAEILSWLGTTTTLVVFALAPWMIAWWPLRQLGRALGGAYSRKWLSELIVVFTAVWLVVLVGKAIDVSTSAGPAAALMLLPLLWIPAVFLVYGRWSAPARLPPTLLVLRVFQRDAQARRLFDQVVERWRLSGNTVLIAGTDLADRTLDAEDLFLFLDRRLPERFVRTAADIEPRLAAIDRRPDLDRRYRVNACYCHDATWQDVLKALMDSSDVVLMDLRGFKAHNAGCRFELTTLAQSARPLRVIVLADGETDRVAAAQSIAGGRVDQFIWVDVPTLGRSTRRKVFAALFGPAPAGDASSTATANAARGSPHPRRWD